MAADSHEVKGTAVLSILGYVTSTYGEEGLERWRASLSPEARALAAGRLSATSWYPGPLAMEMRRAIIDLFYVGDRSRIRELGMFSAQRGLTGVYKLAVKVGSPMWVVDRLSMVFTSYFRPGAVILPDRAPGSVVGTLEGFPDKSGIMEEVFAGFVQKALDISGARDVSVEVRPAPVPAGYVVHMRWR